MAENELKKRIFISACEPSADAHCAQLITAINQKTPAIEWIGVGGEKMAQAGCQLLENTSQRAAMIYNAFGQVGFYYKLLKRIRAYFNDHKIDLVIVCDSPAFNFHIAKAAKKAGVKVLFYVAPQLWAWAPWRIWKLRRLCDKLACILPFEEEWFGSRKVDAEFVGNPLFDGIDINSQDCCKDYSGFNAYKAIVALMPGSREAEIKSLWPAMQKVAVKLKWQWPGVTFLAPAADEEKLKLLKSTTIEGFECEFTVCDVTRSAIRADIALVASGSATLQVAAAGCPMVIMYQSSRVLWHLVGRWLVRTRFFSLVNILAGKELVAEFMPYFSSTEPIIRQCNVLLSSRTVLGKTSRELADLARPLATGSASEKVAAMVLEMIEG